MSLANIQNIRVLVIGDIILDEYIHGSVTRISPEAPIPIVNLTKRLYSLGGAANVAANLVGLGASVDLVGLCQQDRAGLKLRDMLLDYPIYTKLVSDAYRPTTVKTRVVSQQQLLRIDEECIIPTVYSIENLVASTTKLLSQRHYNIIIISDYNKGVITSELMDTVRYFSTRDEIPWVVDPKPIHKHLYRGASFITPNQSEMSAMIGDINNSYSLIKDLSLSGLLVTKGPEGMSLITAKERYDIPTVAKEVYDVSGAGDTVIATFSAALAAGIPIIDAAKLSNIAAGVVVGKLGTAAISMRELEELL